MKQIVQFKLDDGSLIHVETDEHKDIAIDKSAKSKNRGLGGFDAPKEVTGQFKSTIEHIKPVAELVVNTFKEINAPDEIAIEFGLKFNAKVGAILASADSESTFKVSLKWKKNEKDNP